MTFHMINRTTRVISNLQRIKSVSNEARGITQDIKVIRRVEEQMEVVILKNLNRKVCHTARLLLFTFRIKAQQGIVGATQL